MKRLLFSLILCGIALTACDTDPTDSCAGVNCLNDGVCNEGTCTCLEGFTGEYCQSTDDCAGVNCLNGGACNDGTCVCPDGFTGQYCQTTVTTCTGIDCSNNGTCEDGLCDCNAGYEGDNCETEVRAKFIGTYTINQSCSSGGTSSYTLTITANSGNVSAIDIYNIDNQGRTTVGSVNYGNYMDISTQPFGTDNIGGQGYVDISSGTLQIQVNISSGQFGESCTLVGI